MTQKLFLFNGTDGTTLQGKNATDNTGAEFIIGAGAGFNTAVFSTADAWNGSTGARFKTVTGGNGNGMWGRFAATAASTEMAISVGVTIPPTTASFPFMEMRTTADTRTYQLVWNGRLIFVAKNNNYNYVTNNGDLTAGTKYRIETMVSVAGTGSATVKVYDVSGALVASQTFSSITTDSTALSTVSLGVISTTPTEIGADSLIINDGATTEQGPYPPVATQTTVQPISVTTSVNGTWLGSIGALTDSSDATYYESPTANNNETSITYRLAPLSPPTDFNLTLRGVLTFPGTSTTKVRLFQGAIMRKEWTITPTTTIANFNLALTSGEIATITEWSALDLQVAWTGVTASTDPTPSIDPASISGLIQRLRADDIAAADGTAVTNWVDRVSGTATQATTASKPTYRTTAGINGLPSVFFDGGDILSYGPNVNWPAEYTIIVVSQLTSYVQNAGPVGLDVTNGAPRIFQLRHSNTNQIGFISYHSGGASSQSDTTAITGQLLPSVMTAHRSATEARVFWNGASDPGATYSGLTGTTSTVAPLVIGSSARSSIQLFTGYISEVLIYNRALNPGERAQIHSYIQNRYAITVSDYIS